MIRRAVEKDINSIYNIWETEIKKYNKDIEPEIWDSKKDIMINYFNTKNVFVFENYLEIVGFLCIEDDGNIISIFVKEEFQNRKIGTKLLDYIKASNQDLYASVYAKNILSNRFFEQNAFIKKYSQLDNNNCEEFFYEWRRND